MKRHNVSAVLQTEWKKIGFEIVTDRGDYKADI